MSYNISKLEPFKYRCLRVSNEKRDWWFVHLFLWRWASSEDAHNLQDHGHVPQCQILFPGSDHSSLWSLDERHIVEDSEVRLFTSCWYNSLLYRWPSRNYESLPWSRNLRAYHGECRLHQECRVQERYCCSNDGVGWATGWHLRGSHAYPNDCICFGSFIITSHQDWFPTCSLATGLQLGYTRQAANWRMV